MYKKSEKSTAFGYLTPFGKSIPFKYPTINGKSMTVMMSDLAMQLYPTGRAFMMIKNSIMDKFHSALNIQFIRLFEDARLTIESTIPDNENFDEKDCALWEYRFGIISNSGLSLSTRRNAIFRRMSRGRNVPARQHIVYLQYQLQLAGFNVFVHENGFYEAGVLIHKRPEEILALMPQSVEHGGTTQHGIGVQHGGINSEVIANSYLPNELYSVGDDNLWATFFLGGEILGTVASVPEIRQKEFRELVLKLKPAHLAAFTFIDYV